MIIQKVIDRIEKNPSLRIDLVIIIIGQLHYENFVKLINENPLLELSIDSNGELK